jgi:hypothetical protein
LDDESTETLIYFLNRSADRCEKHEEKTRSEKKEFINLWRTFIHLIDEICDGDSTHLEKRELSNNEKNSKHK